MEAANQAQMLQFSVVDTGIGIEPEALEKIFAPFTQANASTTRLNGGTGLGLTISSRLAIAMDGHISVTSKPGHGSTFTLALPLMQVGDSPADVLGDPTRDFSGIRALLVDDTLANLELLTHRLLSLNVRVKTATSADEALELLKSDQEFDIIFLDLIMPGISGWETAHAIRARPWAADVKLIALTGRSRDQDISRAVAAGFDDYLIKPASPGQITAVLNRR